MVTGVRHGSMHCQKYGVESHEKFTFQEITDSEIMTRARGRILGRNWAKEFSSLLFTVTSTNGFEPPPPPPSKRGLKLVCNVNIVFGNLKSDNSQDYAQKPQQNCTFMNSDSGLLFLLSRG